MEVTIENFEEAFTEISSLLATKKIECISFAALASKQDAEQANQSYPFDIYFKTIRFSRTGLIQTGLSFIEIDGDQRISHSYVFYIFPNDEMSQISVSSEVLEKNIDWNKWMSKGIPFKNQESIEKMKLQIKKPNVNPVCNVNEILFKIEENQVASTKNIFDQILLFSADPNKQEMTVPKQQSPVRRAIYEYIEQNNLTIKAEKGNDFEIVLRKCSAEELQAEIDAKNNEILKKIDESKGITKVFELVYAHCQLHQTPFLLFNSFNELSLIIQYTVTYLPRTLSQYKKILSANLPLIVDVKFLMNQFQDATKKFETPTIFVKDNRKNFESIQIVQSRPSNSEVVNSLDSITAIWFAAQDQVKKINTHVNKLNLENSNWTIQIYEKDLFYSGKNRTLVTISPSQAASFSDKKGIYLKFSNELLKNHKKQGIFYNKIDSLNIVIVNIDSTKWSPNTIQAAISNIKDCQMYGYEEFLQIIEPKFEEEQKS